MKKILILSSEYTGYGHTSITQALQEQFAKFGDVEVRVQEGFDLMGKMATQMSKLYGPVTRNMEEVWKLFFSTTQKTPKFTTDMLELLIHDKLMKLMLRWTPDAILSVHPVFNTCVINLLERYQLPIQFYTLIADLVDIHSNWVDIRSDRIFCPSRESYAYCQHHMVDEDRLMRCGFPVREQFILAAQKHHAEDYHSGRPLQALVMSGGEGSGNLLLNAQTLLINFPCHVHVICGRNAALREKFENTLLKQYPDRLHVYGFMRHVEEIMVGSDIVIARGSPNTMMEAVVCNVPLVITGSLPGQEAHNPIYAEHYGLGVISDGVKGLYSAVETLIADEGKLLNSLKASQREFRSFDSAKNIVEDIYHNTEEKQFTFPEFRLFSPVDDRTMRRLRNSLLPPARVRKRKR